MRIRRPNASSLVARTRSAARHFAEQRINSTVNDFSLLGRVESVAKAVTEQADAAAATVWQKTTAVAASSAYPGHISRPLQGAAVVLPLLAIAVVVIGFVVYLLWTHYSADARSNKASKSTSTKDLKEKAKKESSESSRGSTQSKSKSKSKSRADRAKHVCFTADLPGGPAAEVVVNAGLASNLYEGGQLPIAAASSGASSSQSPHLPAMRTPAAARQTRLSSEASSIGAFHCMFSEDDLSQGSDSDSVASPTASIRAASEDPKRRPRDISFDEHSRGASGELLNQLNRQYTRTHRRSRLLTYSRKKSAEQIPEIHISPPIKSVTSTMSTAADELDPGGMIIKSVSRELEQKLLKTSTCPYRSPRSGGNSESGEVIRDPGEEADADSDGDQ